jgi:hypothetical protein
MRVSLIFLRYPDGDRMGWPNGRSICGRRVSSVTTVARRETTYDDRS